MKVKYKGKVGIAALQEKVKDLKKKATPKVFETKFLSAMCKNMKFTGNRKSRRLQTKELNQK